jgi:sugar phosphate isomerase/epimerase
VGVDTVTLFSGYYWNCPHCGNRNWHEGERVPQDMAEEAALEMLELAEALDMGDELVMLPDEVQCTACGLLFFAQSSDEGSPE